MKPSQLQLMLLPHNNQQLFSDYYLNELQPKRQDWNALKREARSVMEQITTIFGSFTPSSNEAQTENELIRPILSLLGHTFEVQPALKTPAGTKRPDYVLYSDEDALKANKNIVLDDEKLASGAFAVADAKYWDRPLDLALKQAKGDSFDNRNPSFQIAFYMQHTGLSWGLLTNGRLWRLYHRDSAHKLDRFYEVDLKQITVHGDIDRFLYFFAFFRREAFGPGPISLNAMLQESIDYALKVGNQLKSQVFDALRHLAQGFLDYPANQLTTDTTTLKAIYDNSLILLYRLLFISYAEARELLPVRKEPYRSDYSLHSITRAIAKAKTEGRTLLPTSGKRWAALKELFHAINLGSPPLSVATFNGGLFDPDHHSFLERYTVGDQHLDLAIDTLARVDGQFVDYRDLAEQHLGTIYEGLLEYQLVEIPPEDGWQIDIANDKGERKRGGSYYTPNYIVKYIVDQTVKPVLDEAVAGKPDSEKVAAILGVNVLDPAMGSAYFLVETIEYIARYIVNLGLPVPEAPDESTTELTYWKRRVAQSCIYGVDINPLAVELAKLSIWLITVASDRPLSFLDHHLRVGNSVVGSRSTVTAQSAGQRKIKAKRARKAAAIDAAAEAIGQISLIETAEFERTMHTAVDMMWLIEGSESATVEEVKNQETIYAQVRQSLTQSFATLANLATAADFGLEIDDSYWPGLTNLALGKSSIVLPEYRRIIDAANALALRERFFHWDLEFPEVFYDRLGRWRGDDAGFDAVVGNPPYVRQERFASAKAYLRSEYGSFNSVADLYVYFFERGLGLIRMDGRLGYITSGTYARANFAKEFRAYLPTAGQVETVIDFGENQPFRGAEMVRPTILILQRTAQSENFVCLFIADQIPSSLDKAVANEGMPLGAEVLRAREWVFEGSESSQLLARLLKIGTPLRQLSGREIRRGVLTGLNKAFVIDELVRSRIVAQDPSSTKVIYPVIAGQDLRPWYQDDHREYIVFARRGFNIDSYPAIKEHLERFRTELTPKPDDWNAAEKWPGRKSGQYAWYEIQDTIEYFNEFREPKIVYPDISKLPRFSFDAQGVFLNNTSYFLPGASRHLLGILQSRVIWFVISRICQPLRLRGGLWQYRLFPQFLDRLPIPSTTANEEAEIAAIAKEISEFADERYVALERTRNRILNDLGRPGSKLNQKLLAWWELDFSTFRAEIKKVFKREIPVKERTEWEDWLADQRAEHRRMTEEIIRLETELNAIVYQLFDLTTDEIALIEQSTKYEYGEV